MNLRKAKSVVFGCLLVTLLQGTGLAQDPAKQDQQRRIELSRELFVDTQKQNARMGLETAPKSSLRIEREFINAVPHFRHAVARYREAISLNSSLKDPLKSIERYVDLFKTYFKSTRVDAPDVDKGEFNTFSRKDLLWESLTTAERMDTQLRLAVLQMQEAITTETVSIDTVLFMRDLHGDLLRFDLLLSKVR
ncbi:MAG TPA: hypothetical protein VFR18_20490 [Terriglobia bacterium]|nr:hypothetical protein [Terriglobia bacterium]